MWPIVKPVLFFVLGGVFKAISDTLQHHFSTSIFKNLDPRFWNPNESWKYVGLIPIIKYRPDAWHLSNSIMLCCFAIACSKSIEDFVLMGIAFIILFNIFYDKVLRA